MLKCVIKILHITFNYFKLKLYKDFRKQLLANMNKSQKTSKNPTIKQNKNFFNEFKKTLTL